MNKRYKDLSAYYMDRSLYTKRKIKIPQIEKNVRFFENYRDRYYISEIFPSVEIVTTFRAMTFPLA